MRNQSEARAAWRHGAGVSNQPTPIIPHDHPYRHILVDRPNAFWEWDWRTREYEARRRKRSTVKSLERRLESLERALADLRSGRKVNGNREPSRVIPTKVQVPRGVGRALRRRARE